MLQKTNRRILAISAIALWVICVSIIFFGSINQVSDLCGESNVGDLCRWFNYLYFSLYAAALISYPFLVHFLGNIWKFTLLLGLLILSLYLAQNYTASELSPVQVYSYELFITTFYLWLIFIFLFFVAALLFKQKEKKIIKCFLILTIIAAVFFAFTGRGSSEHITPLIGGVLGQVTLENIVMGKIIWVIAGLITISTAISLFVFAYEWVRYGHVNPGASKNIFKLSGKFIVILLVPVLSIIPGSILNNMDIKQAQKYIDSIVPKVQDYFEKNKEYPKLISQVIKQDGDVPRLIRNYEYLVYDNKGGYYLSRPDKYCFIFQNPGKNFGYYSITSARKEWKFYSEKSTLDEQYLDICDESRMNSYEGLVAGHLGLPDPDDKLSEINLKMGEVMRPAITQSASDKLEKVLEDAAKKDPSIMDTRDRKKKH